MYCSQTRYRSLTVAGIGCLIRMRSMSNLIGNRPTGVGCLARSNGHFRPVLPGGSWPIHIFDLHVAGQGVTAVLSLEDEIRRDYSTPQQHPSCNRLQRNTCMVFRYCDRRPEMVLQRCSSIRFRVCAWPGVRFGARGGTNAGTGAYLHS